MTTVDAVISAIDSLQVEWNYVKYLYDDFYRRRGEIESIRQNINNRSVKLINEMEKFIEELKSQCPEYLNPLCDDEFVSLEEEIRKAKKQYAEQKLKLKKITEQTRLIKDPYHDLDPTSITSIEYTNLIEKCKLIFEDCSRQITKYKEIRDEIFERCESRQKEILIEYENKNKEYNRIQKRIRSLNDQMTETPVLFKSVAEMIKKDFYRNVRCETNPEDRIKEQIFHFRFERPSRICYRVVCCKNPLCHHRKCGGWGSLYQKIIDHYDFAPCNYRYNITTNECIPLSDRNVWGEVRH